MDDQKKIPIASDKKALFHLLAKPTGAICNIECKYCFFLSKEALYPNSNFRMTDEAHENYIRQLFESAPGPEVNVAWQGGEPTLMGLGFYKRTVELAKKYRKPHQTILYTIQTNGTLLNDDWAAFFKENNYLVGLSIDGPQAMHDAFRVGKTGQGTFDQVMRGWGVLAKHKVDVNVLCTLHAANADHPLEVYKFFRDTLGARYIQFIPIIERATDANIDLANQGWSADGSHDRNLYTQEGRRVTERSIRAEQYGRFLSGIFDEWVLRDVGTVYVQMFDVTLGAHVGQYSLCIHSPTCGRALALEHNGDLYSCDHYVEPDYLLGNIAKTPMADLVLSDKQTKFGQDKFDTLPDFCKKCDVLFACNGGCPKDRFIETPDGKSGLNYLCAGYKLFFHHVDKPMRAMADLLRQGRFADEIMSSPAAKARL